MCSAHFESSLKNIFAAKNMEANIVAYAQCSWITEVSNDALIMKNFTMSHSIRLAIFNDYSKMKLLAVAKTRFVFWIIMLKRFKVIKINLQDWSLIIDGTCIAMMMWDKHNLLKRVLNDLW